MIDSVTIEWDEDGCHLILEGDLTDGTPSGWQHEPDYVNLRVAQPEQLLRAADEQIRPWYEEGEAVRRDFERSQRTGEIPDYVRRDDALEDAGETMREHADHVRKAARERGE